MQKIKKNWEINQNWQFLFILLGIVGLLSCGYFIAVSILPATFEDVTYEYAFTGIVTLLLSFVFYKVTLWLFTKLRTRWNVTYRWELIAIFIVFAITGSLSARLSGPFMGLLGLTKESMSAWLFWPLRMLVIFPIYQVVLVFLGWVFGQHTFFWSFEKKMLARFGIKL
jgi:O-antigen ligase